MKNNPLFIKWFVSSVQSGKRPEEVLQNAKIFLDFCLSNVVEHLSDDARLVAKALLAVPGSHSQSVLSYLTQLDGDRLQLAIQQLITANIVNLVVQSGEAGYESFYDLGELPRLYLLKSRPPSAAEIANFSKLSVSLARTHEQIKAQATINRYSRNSVAIRSAKMWS